jgi:hypothetical protein
MRNLLKTAKLNKKKGNIQSKSTKTAEDISVLSTMAREMGREHSITKMVVIIRVNGKRI